MWEARGIAGLASERWAMFHSAIRHKASQVYDTGLREFQFIKMNND